MYKNTVLFKTYGTKIVFFYGLFNTNAFCKNFIYQFVHLLRSYRVVSTLKNKIKLKIFEKMAGNKI